MSSRPHNRGLAVFILLLAANARADVVINEIMYHAPSNDRDATYVELYNTSPTPVDLTGWHFSRGFTFTFPAVSIPGNDYLVVCRNTARVQEVYGTTKTIGNVTGNLARDGETLELVDATSTVIDLVSYSDRMPWPVRADGNGAALGLINPGLDNTLGENWENEMVANTGWRRIVTRGVFDPVGSIRFYLELDGEALIDDVELIRESNPGVNLLSNPGFESGATDWTFLGNHAGSTVVAGDTHSGANALHVRATGQGSFGANCINHAIAISATDREFFALSLWAKPLDGTNGIALGSGTGRQGTLHEVFHLSQSEPDAVGGSPGQQNVVYEPLPQPLFRLHNRTPDYPAASEPATITVVAENPTHVASMNLYYSVQALPLGSDAPDPDALAWMPVAMAGVGTTFTAVIPGQAGGRIIRYYVVMTSTNGPATFRRPRENDVRQYYGYYVKNAAQANHKTPMFYIQVSLRNEALVNEMADDLGNGMFKGYNLNARADIIDMKTGEYFGDVRTRWRGGVGTRSQKDNIKILFRDEHRWDGQYVLNVTPNNQGRSATTLGLANAVIHDIERRFGVPSLEYGQWARVYYDGGDRGLLTMVEQPDRNLLERFGIPRNQLFKSIGWRLAYPRIRGDEGTFYGSINDGQDGQNKLRDSINNTYTLDEYSHLAYDQELANDRGYTDLVSLIENINDLPASYPITTIDGDYVWFESDCLTPNALTNATQTFLEATCNVDFMLRKWSLDIIGADTDRVIHNHFWCMDEAGKWFLLSWDRDYWSRGNDAGIPLFMQVARWYKPGTTYPNTWRLQVDVHTGSWPTLTVALWPPEFRQRYYGFIREAYETVVTPYTMKNYTDKHLAYVQPEHALAGFTPTLNLSEFQAQQDFINTQRIEVFQDMQNVVDMDPALLTPLVADVRHQPSVPSPAQSVEFQAHAVSSVGTGLPNSVTLMLKGPADASFVAHAMTRIADDPGYTGSVPDPAHTYYYTAPPLGAGQVYQYYAVATDFWGGTRTTTAPTDGPTNPRRVMADDNPALSAQDVVINEIMYNSDLESNEYIELTNKGSRIVDLAGWYVIDTSSNRPFVFERDTTLAPGEFIVIAYNAWRLKRIYGIRNVVGDYAFRLANDLDTVYLYNAAATLIDEVSYLDDWPWPPIADGNGPSLELFDPARDNSDPRNYGRVFPPGHRGTPGAPNYALGSSVESWERY